MQAIAVVPGQTDADALYPNTVPRPRVSPGEILIKVHAAGVNRPDIAQREGNYPPPPGASEIIGLEVAGEVCELGEGVGDWRLGDKVCALLAGGGYAQYACVDARHALPVPGPLSTIEAAALPETVFTVWANLFEAGRLAAGETVLIHGGNSGIGTTAIAMSKAAGATVIATARGPEKAEKAKLAGADVVVDIAETDFVPSCEAAGGVDVVLDILGGSYFARNLAALKTDGRLVQIAFLAGRMVELDLMTLLFKRITLSASTLRARHADEKARLTRAIRETVWPWLEDGRFKPLIDSTYPLEGAARAHQRLENGEQFGKTVLIVD
jgi:putative PIG3 family NAD(P)H quinone oxidoreductase